jgi:hypothetical protein
LNVVKLIEGSITGGYPALIINVDMKLLKKGKVIAGAFT